jgi:large subunit ribosomal protein L29
MDIGQLRGMTDSELEQALRDAKRDLWQARFELATRQLKDYTAISGSRHSIARILTVQH